MKDPLNHIMSQIGRHSIRITQAESLELLSRARAGDTAAGDRLFWSIAKLAVKQCKKYSRNRDHFMELISAAFEGCMRCIYHSPYDPTRGVRFATYIVYYIRAGILLYIERDQWAVAIPKNDYWQMTKDGTLPTKESIDLWEIDSSREHDGFAEVDQAEENEHLTRRLNAAMETISERDREILRQRYMHGEKLHVIGERFGIGKERVRQIRNAAQKAVKRRVSEIGEEEARDRRNRKRRKVVA